eukprot:scaffold185994_cov57-Attheya_sp.AAC.1
MGALALPTLPAAARPGHVLPALSHTVHSSQLDASVTPIVWPCLKKTKTQRLHNWIMETALRTEHSRSPVPVQQCL